MRRLLAVLLLVTIGIGAWSQAAIVGTAATTATESADPAVLSMPAGIVAGELLIAVVAGDGAGDMTESGSAVWTRLDNVDNGTASHGAAFAKIAAGSDTLSVQFGANDLAAVVMRIENHGVTDPAVDIIKGTPATGNTDSPDPPLVNPGVSDAYLWIEWFAADDDDEYATYWSTGFTGIAQRQSQASTTSCLVAAAYMQSTAASLNPGVMLMSTASNEEWIAQTYAIPPGTGLPYSVTYNGNGHTGGTVPVDVSSPYDELATVTVLANTGTLVRTGYTFADWNTAANGTGTAYNSTGTDTFSMPAADVVLYAQWTINTYTLTYDGNTADSGTAPTDASSPYDYAETVTVLGNTGSLVKAGYSFAGWNTQADGGGTGYSPAGTFAMPAANTTLYAVWSSETGDYYVTEAGAGTGDGLSLANAWSMLTFNGSSTPGAGDTVVFSGTITTKVEPQTNGAAGNVLTLNFSAATLNVAVNPQISINGRSYLTLNGGTISERTSGSLIEFGTSVSDNVIIDGFTFTGSATGTASFVYGKIATNLTIRNNTLDNIRGLYWADKNTSHDVTIQNNYARTNTNTTVQTDVVSWGDVYNVTIEGNKFINRAPSAATDSRHNDVIQCYTSGGSGTPPYGIVIRYNWLETNNVGGDGNSSITQLEHAIDSGGRPAVKFYSNVIVGRSGDTSNNGLSMYGATATANYYVYNNTFYGFGSNPQSGYRAYGSNGLLHFRNNAGLYAGSPGTGLNLAVPKGSAWDYNIVSNMPLSNAMTLAPPDGYSYTMADVIGDNGQNVDPEYADTASDDFSPAPGSPLIGGGVALASEYNVRLVSNATWPNPTTIASSAEIGAFAYQAGGTYDLTYDDNLADSGTAPTDGSSPYTYGAVVTTLGNSGNLARTGYVWSGWNTAADGSGTTRAEGSMWNITAHSTLYPRWLSTTAAADGPSTGVKFITVLGPWELAAFIAACILVLLMLAMVAAQVAHHWSWQARRIRDHWRDDEYWSWRVRRMRDHWGDDE